MNVDKYTVETRLNETCIDAPFDTHLEKYGIDNKYKRNSFIVPVSNGSNKAEFDYYMSHIDYKNGITAMTDHNAKEAFNNILMDATYSDESYNDFCDSLGYNIDDSKSKRIYKECAQTAKKLNGLGIGSDDIYNLINIIEMEL